MGWIETLGELSQIVRAQILVWDTGHELDTGNVTVLIIPRKNKGRYLHQQRTCGLTQIKDRGRELSNIYYWF